MVRADDAADEDFEFIKVSRPWIRGVLVHEVCEILLVAAGMGQM